MVMYGVGLSMVLYGRPVRKGVKKSDGKFIKEGEWGQDWTDFPGIVCF